MRRFAFAAALLAASTGLAVAQGPARPNAKGRPGGPGQLRAVRVMGQITHVSGTVYTVKGIRGANKSVTIPANTPVIKPERQKGSVKDLKVGVNIAVSVKAPGTGNAVTAERVMILPPMQVGKVQAISSTKITVKSMDGKTLSYTINAKTRQPKGEHAVKAGDEVIVMHKGSVAEAIRHAGGRGMGRPGGPGRGPRAR